MFAIDTEALVHSGRTEKSERVYTKNTGGKTVCPQIKQSANGRED